VKEQGRILLVQGLARAKAHLGAQQGRRGEQLPQAGRRKLHGSYIANVVFPTAIAGLDGRFEGLYLPFEEQGLPLLVCGCL
jgi:hypothetical protein